MKLTGSILFLTFGIAAIIFSCKSKKDNPNPGTTPSVTLDTLKGKMNLIDEFGQPMSDASGIIVKLILNSDTIMTDTTDIQGSYLFPGLDNSKYYDVILTKSGFGTCKFIHVYTNNFIRTMSQISSTIALPISIDSQILDSKTTQYILNGNISPAVTSGKRLVRFYLGTDTTVSPSNYLYTDTISIKSGSSYSSHFADNSALINLFHIVGGSKLYTVVYGESINDQLTDDENGKTIYPALNSVKSNVAVFRVKPNN